MCVMPVFSRVVFRRRVKILFRVSTKDEGKQGENERYEAGSVGLIGEKRRIICSLTDCEEKVKITWTTEARAEATYPPTYNSSSPGTLDSPMFDGAGL